MVGQDYKYIYWPYETGDYEATEELFKISDDPLELKNLVISQSAPAALQSLRKVYDARVKKMANSKRGLQRLCSVRENL